MTKCCKDTNQSQHGAAVTSFFLPHSDVAATATLNFERICRAATNYPVNPLFTASLATKTLLYSSLSSSPHFWRRQRWRRSQHMLVLWRHSGPRFFIHVLRLTLDEKLKQTKNKMKRWTSLISKQFIARDRYEKSMNGKFLYRVFVFFLFFLIDGRPKKMLLFQNGFTSLDVAWSDDQCWSCWSLSLTWLMKWSSRTDGLLQEKATRGRSSHPQESPPSRVSVKTSVYVRTGIFSMRSVYSCVLSAVFWECQSECYT